MALFLYRLLGIILIPGLLVRLLWRSRSNPAYRRHVAERLGIYFGPAQQHSEIWLHAVSVGEANAAIPLARALLHQQPGRALLISCTTPTGRGILQAAFDAKKEGNQAVSIVYLPFDFFGASRRFFRRFQPQAGIIMETELWPNLIDLAHQAGCRLLVANLRLSAKSARGYARLPWLVTPMLAKIDAFAVQYADDAERLQQLGAAHHKISVTGNLKFDQQLSQAVRAQAERLRHLFADRPVWVAGSTHAGEDEIILAAFSELKDAYPELLLVLAPRHPERFAQVAALIEAAGFGLTRRSGWSEGRLPVKINEEVLLLDSVGELSALIASARVAFVGGSLVPVGGHNVLEACVAGVPVVFGPHMHNFAKIAEMVVAAGAGTQIDQQKELAAAVHAYLAAPEEAGQRGRALIKDNQGALAQTLQLIEQISPSRQGASG